MLAGQQELRPENGHSTEMESYLKPFHELPSARVDNVVQSASSTPLHQTEKITKTATQVTASDDKTQIITPAKESPLLLRLWVPENFQCDDKISSAVEQLETAIKEVEKAGRNLQACIDQSQREVANSRQEVDRRQKELKHYQERCAKAEDCERELRRHYESQVNILEGHLTKLELEKKEENTTHTTELKNLKQQHEEETKDLQYTIKLQAKHCRELDSDLEELRSSYANKEQEVAKLRETLDMKERELAELGRAVKEKEDEKRNKLQKQKGFAQKALHSMLLEKEELGKKLKTCEGISELVSNLPNLASQAERDETTKEVIAKLRDILITSSAKKALSWR